MVWVWEVEPVVVPYPCVEEELPEEFPIPDLAPVEPVLPCVDWTLMLVLV